MSDPRERIARLGGDTSKGPIAICEWCDFMVQHEIHAPVTVNETIEIATFLREQLFAHMRDAHPERRQA